MANHRCCRRNFMRTSLLSGVAFAASRRLLASTTAAKPSFPVTDYHVHLSPQLSIEQAVNLGKERQVQIGIVEHPGPGFRINNDGELKQYIDGLRRYPVRVGLQPVYAGWSKAFSKGLLDQLDYVLMDALTMPRPEGGWRAIWQIDTMVDDEQGFMGRYMKFIEQVLTTEPLDIFGWPTFLPVPIARKYKELWTRERVGHIIELARARNIAMEINEVAHVPDENFILTAKKAGLKFTFGTDSRNQNAAHFYYCYQMVQKCGLTARDMYAPKRRDAQDT